MRLVRTSVMIGLALVLTASAAMAEGDACPAPVWEPLPDCTCRADYEVSLDLGIYSKYVWRGIVTTDGFVAQPSIDFTSHGFGVNVWANLDLESVNDQQFDFTEVDLTASYGFRLGKFDFQAGAISYLFPTGGDQTTELFAGVTWDVPLSPTLTVYQDIDEVDGTYAALSGAWTFEDPLHLGGCRGVSPELSASLAWGSRGFNEAYYGSDASGFADLTLGLTVPYRISRWATLRASVHWSSLLDGAIRDASDDPDNLWFGIGVNLSL
jgi:uncharacterized protein (TIGR02001 family)